MKKTDEGFCTWVLENDVEIYADMIYRLALTRVKNIQTAQDITQSVFLSLIRHVRKFYAEEKQECLNCQNPNNFTSSQCFASNEHKKAWLLRVTLNLTKDYFKGAEYQRTQKLDLPDLEIEDSLTDIYHAVLSLEEPYKSVIHLFYTLNFSVKEISELMQTKENTIKSWLHRGRKQLKTLLLEE